MVIQFLNLKIIINLILVLFVVNRHTDASSEIHYTDFSKKQLEQQFLMAKNYFLESQYVRALNQFDRLQMELSSSLANEDSKEFALLKEQSRVGSILSLHFLGDNQFAIQEFHKEKFFHLNGEHVQLLKKYLNREEILNEEALKNIHHEVNSSGKSLWISGILSGVLPGSGMFYTESYASGVITFLLNALTFMSMKEFSDRDLQYPAYASGLVFSIFYVGNIYASVQSAKSYNRRIEAPLRHKAQEFAFPLLNLQF